MNKIRIPKEFQIFGHIYKIKLDPSLIEKDDSVGEFDPRNYIITLQPKKGICRNRPNTHFEQTFLHELTHAVLHEIGAENLCDDDKFVDLFSQALHQALKTMKY